MNNLHRLFTALALTVITLSAAAQERIDKAIDDFVTDSKGSVFVNMNTKEVENGDDKPRKAYYNKMDFTLKSSAMNKLEKLRDVFQSETKNAYRVMIKDAYSRSDEQMVVAYGVNLGNNITYGTRKDRNYIVLNIRDDKDSTWRWSYALMWDESPLRTVSSTDHNVSGSIVSIYSKDPAMTRSGDGNAKLNTTVLPDGTVVTYDSDRDMKTVVYKNSNVVGNGSAEYSDVDSSSRFLVVFGNLRSLFLDAKREKSGLAMQTTIASRMLDLCKNKGSLLSKDERALCRTTLIDMSNVAEDKYVTGLLRMAADALK